MKTLAQPNLCDIMKAVLEEKFKNSGTCINKLEKLFNKALEKEQVSRWKEMVMIRG